MMRSSVDFPQPEAPTRQTNSPCAISRLIGDSASTSSSPIGKRLVAPRIVSMCEFSPSFMMLRTPLQDAVADHHNNPIGDEAAGTDDDHPGNDQIGARQRAAIHDNRSQPGRDTGHFADHYQDPRKAMRDTKSVEDRRQ